MAERTQSVAATRRAARAAEERRQRLILLGALGGLAAVAAVILAGLYVTQYRAPRAHVLTVGGRDYDAAAVARRANYYVLFEGGLGQVGVSGVAAKAVALLVDEQALREGAPATVGAVSDDDVEGALAERFGLEGLGDADSRQQFAEALQTAIRSSGLSRDEYFDLTRVGLLRERLSDGFRDEMGAAAPQLRLERIRLAVADDAERVRALALEGDDFAALVAEHSTDTEHRDDGGDLGWLALELLDPRVREAVAELGPGDVAPVVASGLFFDLYRVSERDERRELEEEQIALLVDRRLGAWLESQRTAVAAERDLSRGEGGWITDRVCGLLDERGLGALCQGVR